MHVVLLLKEAVRFFNCSISDTNLAFYAKRVTLDYHYWRIEDLCICLNRGISGNYGISKKNWSYETFIEWATQYDNERNEYYEFRQKENQKQLAEFNAKNPVPVEEFTKLAEKFTVPKEVKTQNVQTRERNKADELIDEFEGLNKAQNGVKTSMGFVTYLKRKMDLQKYITIRNDETK